MRNVDAYRDRALSLLRMWDANSYFSNFKITQVNVAGLWYRGPLGCFAALSLLLMIYHGYSQVTNLACWQTDPVGPLRVTLDSDDV
jgi:hypothetical protein